MIGVYRITNNITGDFYIGSSKDIESRIRKHLYVLRSNKKVNVRLQNSFNKYGEEAFIFDVVELCSQEQQLNREQYWINALNPQFNAVRNVFKIHYKTIPEEIRRKISIANTGKRHSPEVIKRVADKNRGRRASEETRRKISLARKGKGTKHIHSKEVVGINVLSGEILHFKSISDAIAAFGSTVPKVLIKKHQFTGDRLYHWLYKSEFVVLDAANYLRELQNKREALLARGK